MDIEGSISRLDYAVLLFRPSLPSISTYFPRQLHILFTPSSNSNTPYYIETHPLSQQAKFSHLGLPSCSTTRLQALDTHPH